ncbi:LOW QUALITY PROTEIN: uncharacterized protein [Eurosta solidaginis]|uniref:LOW QUALITY PROTEIN: uncharacterized protein n=1 Tax=Eurosta solidaginis TaxID=178769 RepID=UPI003530945B
MLEYLNDDCLSEIFQYLNVKEQLIVTAVSERFCQLIVERFWRLKFHKFTTHSMANCNELNLAEFEVFYRLMVPHITELNLSNTTSTAFTSYLGRYTKRPNLDFYFHFEYPELSLLYCKDEHFYNGYLKVMARKCPKLANIKLVSPYVTGQYLADMPNLVELSLNSSRLEPIYFKDILNNHKILYLQLNGETTSKHEMANVLNMFYPKITELRYYDEDERLLDADAFTTSAHSFRNLTKLYCKRLINFAYSLHTLKELHFESNLRMQDLLKLIDNNFQLEQLYLGPDFHFAHSREWVCELSDYVRHQQKERKRILNINLDWVQKYVQQLQQILEHHDMRHGHLKPAIKIEKLPIDTSEFPILISKTGIEFVLKWD